MKRRDYISLIGARWPLAARAQQRPIPRIGVIAQSPIWDHFRRGLNELGYLDGRDMLLNIDLRKGSPTGSLQSQANSPTFRSIS
jgi:hypothetical protein